MSFLLLLQHEMFFRFITLPSAALQFSHLQGKSGKAEKGVLCLSVP